MVQATAFLTPRYRGLREAMADIQGVSGGIVNILGGGSMDYSE